MHSPKFDHEATLESLKKILVRYQRAEPVVNDPEHRMMRAYGVRAWPTLAVIDPLGRFVGNRVLIADTNNGRILSFDVESGEWREWIPAR